MSNSATHYLAENLPELRRASFTEPSGKVRPLGENGLTLLLYLCDRTNKEGVFFMQSRTMAEETGLSLSAVKRWLAGFEQLGWITRTGEVFRYQGRGTPTPVYGLTLVPGLWTSAQNERTGIPTGTPGDTRTARKANKDKGSTNSFSLEPKPEPEPQPEPQPEQGSGLGKERGANEKEVFSDCLAWEHAHYTGTVGAGLRKTWERDYRRLVALALEVKPEATKADQVAWCVAQRYAERGQTPPVASATITKHLPDPPTGSPDCEHGCDNGLHFPRDPVTDLVTSRKCVCAGGNYPPTHEATTKRVITGEGANTYIPLEGDTADPQSDPVRELTRQLRRVV
jgi:hypothetical protein